MAAKCWGRRNDKTLLNGYGVLCWADRNALELKGGGSPNTVHAPGVTELYT